MLEKIAEELHAEIKPYEEKYKITFKSLNEAMSQIRQGNTELLDYFSSVIRLGEKGIDSFIKPKQNKKNAFIEFISGFNDGSLKLNNLKELLEYTRPILLNAYIGTGIVPVTMFYTSNDIDKSRLESLLKEETYKEFKTEHYEGIKSRWISEKKGKVNYCVYIREGEGKKPILELKYIAKSYDSAEQKYDIVVEFDRTGIRKIKHVETEAKNLQRSEFEKKLSFFPERFKPFTRFVTSYFKEKAEKGEIELRFQDDEETYEETRSLNNSPIDQRVLKVDPLLAGGAFKYVLNFVSNNYDNLVAMYKNNRKDAQVRVEKPLSF